MQCAECYDIPVDDPLFEALNGALSEYSRVPVYFEGPALQELETGLHDDAYHEQSHDAVEEYAPTAVFAFHAEQEACDREFDERYRPEPEYLGDEEEFERGPAARE